MLEKMRPIATDGVAWSICMSASWLRGTVAATGEGAMSVFEKSQEDF